MSTTHLATEASSTSADTLDSADPASSTESTNSVISTSSTAAASSSMSIHSVAAAAITPTPNPTRDSADEADRSKSLTDSLVTVSLSSESDSGDRSRASTGSDVTVSVAAPIRKTSLEILSGPIEEDVKPEILAATGQQDIPTPDSLCSNDDLLKTTYDAENTVTDGQTTTLDTPGSPPRPKSPSLRQLGQLVHDQLPAGLRVSTLPERPLTELEFWSYVVRDFATVVSRLPSLTTNKLRAGIPAPLRGLVWASVAGVGVGTEAASTLTAHWERLANQPSPFSTQIAKDVGRCFPGIALFRPQAAGQDMLRRVLAAYSLYDPEIGYCQGLGFVAGALVMQMPEPTAFAVLVRLMDGARMRSLYRPDLAGLHLAIFQFRSLLRTLEPGLAAHLDGLHIDGAFLAQWFLSAFATSCPLPVLFRLFDVMLYEGPQLVLLRVGLALVQRNNEALLAASDFEGAMRLLLSRKLWDVYGLAEEVGDSVETMSSAAANGLMTDLASLASVVTTSALTDLEAEFEALSPDERQLPDVMPVDPQCETVEAGPVPLSTRFLSRFWSSTAPATPKPVSRTTSKADQTVPSSSSSSAPSNPVSIASSTSQLPAVLVVPESGSRRSGGDSKSSKSISRADRSLHDQIEHLLTALRDLQLEHSAVAEQLRTERECRARDLHALSTLVSSTHAQMDVASRAEWTSTLAASQSRARRSVSLTLQPRKDRLHSRSKSADSVPQPESLHSALAAAQVRLAIEWNTEVENPFEPPLMHIMRQNLESVSARATASEDALTVRDAQILRLTDQLTIQTVESEQLRTSAREASDRSRDWTRLVDELRDVRAERDRLLAAASGTGPNASSSSSSSFSGQRSRNSKPVLKQLRLGSIDAAHLAHSAQVTPPRSPPAHRLHSPGAGSAGRTQSPLSPVIRRASAGSPHLAAVGSASGTAGSAGTQTVAQLQVDLELTLIELAKAKTAEASALQDRDEMQAKLDSLRRAYSRASQEGEKKKAVAKDVKSATGLGLQSGPSASASSTPVPAPATGGGFWSGWRRGASAQHT